MRIKHPWLTKLASAALVMGLRAIMKTARLEMHLAPGTSPYEQSETHFVYSVWHDSMVVPIFGGKQPHTVALVGRHRDGSYVSNVLKAVGIGSVRGSSSKGGAEALRQLLQDTEGMHIVMTPDGPRGPRRELKQGLAFTASRTGKAVVPTAFSCNRAWKIKGSWTDQLIPKPFSRVYALTGEPILIPPKARREELDHFLRLVQAEMDRLNAIADELAQGNRDALAKLQEPTATRSQAA